MANTARTDDDASELDERTLDTMTGGAAAAAKPAKVGTGTGGSVTGQDDWEKHNV